MERRLQILDTRPADRPRGPPADGAQKPDRARTPPTLLTFETILGYLSARGFLSARDVEETEERTLRILDYSSRNRIFKVVFPSGKGLLVKQGAAREGGAMHDGIFLEAALLRDVRIHDAFRALRWSTPRFVHFDPANAVLVTELVHPATTLSKYHLNAGDVAFPDNSARTGARILAAFHRAGEGAIRQGVLPALPRRRPFIWNVIPALERDTRKQEAGPRVRLLAQLRDAPFMERLPALAQEWDRHAHLVHSDPRWDNFILTSGPGPRDDLNLRLIDWEFACVGDAAWDVSYFLCEYLRFWVGHAPQLPNVASLEALERQARFLPARWRDATARFWETYCQAARLSGRDAEVFLGRVRAYLPLNLALVAYEALPGAPVRPWGPGVAFELALQAHEDPDAFLDRWLGIAPRGNVDG